MTRVKRGSVARKRRKQVLEITKGAQGARSTLFRTANQQAITTLANSHRDAGRRKRDLRSLWILRINAAIRGQGTQYNVLLHKLRAKHIGLNRKMLAQMCVLDETGFSSLVSTASSVV
uniref:ribosomal protein L20 n=1 Tax=Streptosarcina costaricana TaxID=2058783 RepID=UPI00286C1589|nr:ribosomal protein L20 [Streptosarcina costaricana]WKT08970.1 ribosomal protein L20 [Streptosarcina costaricana]